MVNQRLIRAPPPSPPQSNDGDLPSDASQPGDMYSLDGSPAPAPYSGSGLNNDVSFIEQDSVHINLQYAPTSDYPQNPALHHPGVVDTIRVSTPPADDGYQSASSSRWQTPPYRATIGRTRVSKSPRQRRRQKQCSQSDGGITMPAPLSVLTKDMTHIPLKDMDRHVNRPIEERIQETTKKGKIPRPMNSFMLYRSAYADRTKELFRQQNHQVVSAAAGESWNKEEPDIREKYEMLASIEKKNHLKAHPGYKFTPAKDKKKHRMGLDDDRYYGYRSTPERSPAPHTFNRTSAYSTPEIGGKGWDSGHPTPPDMNDHGLPHTDGYLGSWPTTYSGRPTSGMMITSDPNQYMPTSNADEMHYPPSTALAGLPGAAHQDLLGPQGQQMLTMGGNPNEHFIDPQLWDQGSMPAEASNQAYNPGHSPSWQEQASGNNTYISYQAGVQALDPREAWPSQTHGLEHPAGGVFDDLIQDGQGY
ncbi:hypothetical protein BDV19DRAFT_370795 [Aspergillus venezuelensis]